MRNSSKGSSLDILSTTSVPTEPGNICLCGYKTFMRGLQICYISWQPSIEVFFCGFPGAGAWRINVFFNFFFAMHMAFWRRDTRIID